MPHMRWGAVVAVAAAVGFAGAARPGVFTGPPALRTRRRLSGAPVAHNVSGACAHEAETAPACKNDATLFAYLGDARGNKAVQTDNCATCVCANSADDEWSKLNDPARGTDKTFERSWGRCCAGWNGTACDVCETTAACPAPGNRS